MGKDQELLEAARNGNIPVVEKILSQRAKRSGPLASLRRGPGANVQDSSGYSALHHAALNGHKDIVQLLLSYEASTNIVDVKGSSPLHLAAWTGNVDIVRLLLCHGPSVPNVNLTTKDNETALHCAAQYGHTAVVSQLLEHSCDPSIRNSREETALDLAAQYGRLETVELLVRTHPELIEPYTSPGAVFPHTPLHLASRNGHKAVVGVLLSAGMDVNARTAAGTALHEAAMYGKLEVVRALLAAGVDVRARDQRRHTVMELLGQFPAHVTHDIAAIISRHRDCGGGDELPPIPVPDPSLGSPYENVRVPSRGALRNVGQSPGSSPGTSPTHWHFYHDHGDERERRVSGLSSASAASDGAMFQTPPPPKSLPDSFLSAEEGDQISVSSSSSLYMPMCGGSHTKVSPTPPKKPPRRNLSVSPTHAVPPTLMSMSADGAGCRSGHGGGGGGGGGNYEYLYLARSGRSHGDLRRGRSADQYVDMRPPIIEPPAFRTQNPRRKLRRSHNYENYEPVAILATKQDLEPEDDTEQQVPCAAVTDEEGSTFVSSAHITLRTSPPTTPLSPTHYQQPPTPDHPPPSALQAERSIHERIRPLSQEYKRRSRDIETETEEELLLFPAPGSLEASSGSLSSSVSLSDKSVSTDNNVEEFLADAPFAGVQNSPAPVQTAVGHWLASLGLADYEPIFINSGYDDLDFINGVLEERDLREMGVTGERDRASILRAAQSLPKRVPTSPLADDVDEWLSSLRLDCYRDTFRRHLYCDMARVRRVWEVELSAVLDIGRLGHRRRMLASVGGARPPDLEGLSADLDQLKSNIQQLKEEIREKLPAAVSSTGTLGRPRKARPAPPPPQQATAPGELSIREPAQLLVGVPSAITTTWRHRPHALVTGAVTYIANYLGSTLVKELRGTESTKKSIQKLKKTTRESRTTPDIVLSISYRGVKFLNTLTQELVCEHEIRNIHCACQDADDMTHFAYITKDHSSKSHFCHVFCVETMDQATEVILTLGQAFEVAYQMALREQMTPHQHHHHHHQHNNNNNNNNNNNSNGNNNTTTSTTNGGNGHIRSASVSQPLAGAAGAGGHSRSQSTSDLKLVASSPRSPATPAAPTAASVAPLAEEL